MPARPSGESPVVAVVGQEPLAPTRQLGDDVARKEDDGDGTRGGENTGAAAGGGDTGGGATG